MPYDSSQPYRLAITETFDPATMQIPARSGRKRLQWRITGDKNVFASNKTPSAGTGFRYEPGDVEVRTRENGLSVGNEFNFVCAAGETSEVSVWESDL